MAGINIQYEPLDRFVIRAPILSVDATDNLNVKSLYKSFQNNIIKESLFIASPNLYHELDKLRNVEDLIGNRKLQRSLLKYYSRMSHRCTPFGLFSGFILGEFSTKNKVVLKDRTEHKKVTKLDMNYLCSLAQNLEKSYECSTNLLYYPNNSLYKIGSEYRYVEYRYINGERNHFTSSVYASTYLEKVLTSSSNGVSLHKLILNLQDSEISSIEAENFLIELIENQILISNLTPTVTGVDYLHTIINHSKNVFNFDIVSSLSRLDQAIGGENIVADMNLIGDQLLELNPEAKRKYLFQTDLKLNTESKTLSSNIIPNLKEGLSILNKISSKRSNKRLTEFKKAFLERYEYEEIPLNLVLDVESGIGYDLLRTDYFDYSSLTDDLILKNEKSWTDENSIYWSKVEEFILGKYLKYLKDSSRHLTISPKELSNFEENWDQFPNTFSLMLNVLSVRNDEKPLIRLDFAGNASAGNFIARFGHMDSEIVDYLNEIADEEKDENYITAEILHLPESRTGNIISRPRLREYEIPYLAQSTLPVDKQIKLDDLLVSVKNDRINIRSKSLNKLVRPILTNAHNYWHNSLPTYQFLCDMQGQGLYTSIGFQWPKILKKEKFLPRVICKNFILSPAQYRFNKSDYKDLNSREALIDWLNTNSIPEEFYLKEGDNELYFHMKTPLFQDLFISEISKKSNILLEEYLFDKDNSLIESKKSTYTNEFLFAFKKSNK
ncbi:lantibiotic dehydratase family protein [Christiangramia sp. LLG6405-1]|uniref:lantibiotic dehydratase family protein n=1 Tax=Christiangramia sp. LLG6405-1 TaxID=3160832 RepID=UPI0038694190